MQIHSKNVTKSSWTYPRSDSEVGRDLCNVCHPPSDTEDETYVSQFVNRDSLGSFRSSNNTLRRKSYSLFHVSPPEPRLHQRKQSSTVWFKKPVISADYKNFSDYDDGDDANAVARVRRAIEECAEEDVRAIFDRRSAWDIIKSVIIDEDVILKIRSACILAVCLRHPYHHTEVNVSPEIQVSQSSPTSIKIMPWLLLSAPSSLDFLRTSLSTKS